MFIKTFCQIGPAGWSGWQKKPLGWSSRKFHTCLGTFHVWFPIQGLVPRWEAPGSGAVCSAGAGGVRQRACRCREHQHLSLAVVCIWAQHRAAHRTVLFLQPNLPATAESLPGHGDCDQQTASYMLFSKFLWLRLLLAYTPQEKAGEDTAVGTALHYLHRCVHPPGVLWCRLPHVYRGVTLGDRVSLRGNNSVSFSQLPIFTKLWRNLLFLRSISSSPNLGGNQLKHLQPVQITSSKVTWNRIHRQPELPPSLTPPVHEPHSLGKSGSRGFCCITASNFYVSLQMRE